MDFFITLEVGYIFSPKWPLSKAKNIDLFTCSTKALQDMNMVCGLEKTNWTRE